MSRQIIEFVYGTGYSPSALPFFIMCLTFIPVFISGVLGNTLFALQKEKHLLIYIALGVTGNIIFNILLIPQLGGAGSALSTLLNQLIITAYLIYVLKHALSLQITRYMLKPYAAGFIALVLTVAFALYGLPLFVTLFLCCVCYYAALLLLREPLTTQLTNHLRALRK